MPQSSPVHVWFNKSFAVTAALTRSLDAARYAVHVSHTDGDHASLHAAPRPFLEPRNLVGAAYGDWMLDTALGRGIGIIVAAKEREVLADEVERFAQAGVQLIVPATRQTQRHLDHKDEFLRAWNASVLPIAEWRGFDDLPSFDRAVAELRLPGTRLCMKPVQSIYANGFRVLTEQPSPRSFFGGELYQMTYAAARELLQAGQTPPMLLMHTLEGAERSIDGVAWRGELLTATVRRKLGAAQRIENRPDLLEAARQIARTYQLSGMFNFQMKDAKTSGQPGEAHLLEINARASGGSYLSMAGSGVDPLALLLDAACGEVRQVWGRTDVTVAERKSARMVTPAIVESAVPDPVGA